MFNKINVPKYLIALLFLFSIIFVFAGMTFYAGNMNTTDCIGCVHLIVIIPFMEIIFNPLRSILSPLPNLVFSNALNMEFSNIGYFITTMLFIRFLFMAILAIIPFLLFFLFYKNRVDSERIKKWNKTMIISYVAFVIIFFFGINFVDYSEETSVLLMKDKIDYICRSETNCNNLFVKANIEFNKDYLVSGVFFPRLTLSVFDNLKDLTKEQASRLCEAYNISDPFRVNCKIEYGLKDVKLFTKEECLDYTTVFPFSYNQSDLDRACFDKLIDFVPISLDDLGVNFEYTKWFDGKPQFKTVDKDSQKYYALYKAELSNTNKTLYEDSYTHVSIIQAHIDSKDSFSDLLWVKDKPWESSIQRNLISTTSASLSNGQNTIFHIGGNSDITSRIKFVSGDSVFIVEIERRQYVKDSEKDVAINQVDDLLVSVSEKIIAGYPN